MERTIKLIIVDDHPVVLQGFAYMLQGIDYINLLAQFTVAKPAIDFVAENEVDVVLLDINLPDMNGIEACRQLMLLRRGVKVVAISNINEHSIIQRILDSGASGYLLKNCSSDEVIECIDTVLIGETGLSADVKKVIARHRSGDLPVVTRREQEVLALLAQGLNSAEIGARIFVSPLTVESHRRNLLQKFKVSNVAALVYRASELKYI